MITFGPVDCRSEYARQVAPKENPAKMYRRMLGLGAGRAGSLRDCVNPSGCPSYRDLKRQKKRRTPKTLCSNGTEGRGVWDRQLLGGPLGTPGLRGVYFFVEPFFFVFFIVPENVFHPVTPHLRFCGFKRKVSEKTCDWEKEKVESAGLEA